MEGVDLPHAEYIRCAPSRDMAKLVHDHRFEGRVFHVLIALHHRKYLHFAFGGR